MIKHEKTPDGSALPGVCHNEKMRSGTEDLISPGAYEEETR